MNKKLLSLIIAGCICTVSSMSAAPGIISADAAQLIASLRGISVEKDVIAVGESLPLVFDWSNGALPEVTFSSSDESVAAVDEKGVITGISSGTAVISASVNPKAAPKTVTVTVSDEVTESVTYNTSEMKLGDKFRKYDVLHCDTPNKGRAANVVNTKGSYDVVFISEGDYRLPFDAELVGIDGLYIYLAPQIDGITYLDGRTLNPGDTIDRSTHLLCYDYVINRCVFPVFLPEYYDKYIGEGTIRLKEIDHEKKTITLEAVAEDAPTLSGDVNKDGEISVADAVMLQKWLMNAADAELGDWTAADLNGNGRLDAFDMCLMRKLLSQEEPAEESAE